MAALAALLSGIWFLDGGEATTAPAETVAATARPRLEVVRPAQGGLRRLTVQPGSVHPFEWADLQSKVAGYLKTLTVDIGDLVKRDQVLAEIDAPELRHDAEESEAAVAKARAMGEVARARVASAEADLDAAKAMLAQSEADLRRLIANRVLAEKQYERQRILRERQAIEERLLDEQRQNLEAAIAGEHVGAAAIQTAKAQIAAARAKVDQARAEVGDADASLRAAEARAARARVLVAYAQIRAPFDGVVTRRNFHPSAFIPSSADQTTEPILRVQRTDLIRVVVQVPDRDVAWLDIGDPATVAIDGLKGESFTGRLARLAEAEDPATRTMRVEIDLPNPMGRLRAGMYGRVEIQLSPPSNNYRLPLTCVLRPAGAKETTVFVVKDRITRRVPVKLGDDDGLVVEVLEGIVGDEQVVVRPPTSLRDGDEIIATSP